MIRALVVEDSPTIAEAVAQWLRAAGVDVVAMAATEDQGLLELDRRAGELELLVVDLQLAQGTGFGIIRRRREHERYRRVPSAKIIVFTNHAVPALKVACFEAGADYFLDKSRHREELVRLAGELVRKRLEDLRAVTAGATGEASVSWP
jgi:two-component system OmpR family response regulator